MPARLLTLSLLALLLLNTLGCTREEHQAPLTIAGTGSYRFAGHLVPCQASATLDTSYSPSAALEIVDISLTTTSEDQVGSPQSLVLEFQRPVGQPSAAYKLAHLIYLGGNDKQFQYSDAEATIQETNSGAFTGTFSGSKPGEGTISAGSFTQVKATKEF